MASTDTRVCSSAGRSTRFEEIVLHGGHALQGELRVQGAKNSVLPLLAASVLCRGESVLHDCPKLSDVETAVRILRRLGCRCRRQMPALRLCGSITGQRKLRDAARHASV